MAACWSEARELKQLREENAKLTRLVGDLSLDKAMLQDVVQKNSKDRQATCMIGKAAVGFIPSMLMRIMHGA